jgi:hypothetical protein
VPTSLGPHVVLHGCLEEADGPHQLWDRTIKDFVEDASHQETQNKRHQDVGICIRVPATKHQVRMGLHEPAKGLNIIGVLACPVQHFFDAFIAVKDRVDEVFYPLSNVADQLVKVLSNIVSRKVRQSSL